MELDKIDCYTNQIIITQNMVHRFHNQLLVMSSALLFLRYNISGEREFIVQNINSAFVFFNCILGYNSGVIDAPSMGANSVCDGVFSEGHLV